MYDRSLYRRNRPIVLEEAGWRCEWPGCVNRATSVDHIVPICKGGSNDRANLRASCVSCNSRGAAKLMNDTINARALGRQSRRW